ncbi:phosphatidic acid phosphatase type 2/haloperoxidase [Zychaea mexicana]|uniref:phosphatidic acid phosphatase type 2/haloperoxidase n=1 Tax=Zychaea mexicana TaxID=64656 RepID=UPI0022FE0490|nr:phosphatidic acid phosphatase type 2/haloperoxidase [Zychaea mexicana]KAI9499371.1 phosphatidic acid phosphatase type 2/haloperoxidase [Zychaea mexicana]
MSLRVDWKSPHTKRIIVSYLPDWILVILMAGAFYGIDQIPPFHREFSLEDKTIMFPHSPSDSVPMWVVGVICLAAPIVIIAIMSLGFKRSIIDFHSGILGLGLSLSMCLMLTTTIKITVGRPRPDFLDRCQPAEGSVDPPFGLSNYTVCTSPLDTHEMLDGFKSFPSGHSSFSFAGLLYLGLFIAGKMQMFDERGHTYKGFIFAFPFIGALLVAISRTQDYRHHWQDVFIGSLLGSACAWFAYRQYYPSLAHSTPHHPFKSRIHFFKHGTSNERILRYNQEPVYNPGRADSEHGLLGDDPGNAYAMQNTRNYPQQSSQQEPQNQQYPYSREGTVAASSSYDPPSGKI